MITALIIIPICFLLGIGAGVVIGFLVCLHQTGARFSAMQQTAKDALDAKDEAVSNAAAILASTTEELLSKPETQAALEKSLAEKTQSELTKTKKDQKETVRLCVCGHSSEDHRGQSPYPCNYYFKRKSPAGAWFDERCTCRRWLLKDHQ